MDKKEFYEKCAEIVGVTHQYNDRKSIKTFDRETGKVFDTGKFTNRWGGREPGNGRFPGVGTIRYYGSVIHITLTNPRFSGTYTGYEAALAALRDIFPSKTNELKIGDFIPVVLGGIDYGMCEIVEYHEEFHCWRVLVEIEYPNGLKETVKRFYNTDNS